MPFTKAGEMVLHFRALAAPAEDQGTQGPHLVLGMYSVHTGLHADTFIHIKYILSDFYRQKLSYKQHFWILLGLSVIGGAENMARKVNFKSDKKKYDIVRHKEDTHTEMTFYLYMSQTGLPLQRF